MPDVAFRAGEPNAVNDGVGVADRAQRLVESHMAAAIAALGNQKNRPAILNRLFAQQIDREGERVERGTAIVSVVVMDQGLNRLCRSIREVILLPA